MKKIFSGAILCLIAGNSIASPAPTDGLFYANKISVYGIAALQQSISTSVFGAYDYYGLHVGRAAQSSDINQKDWAGLYGTMPLYGSPSLYGEWNDDGSVTRGHNGGDNNIAPHNLNLWARWTNNTANDKFSNFKKVHQHHDAVLIGIGTNKNDIGPGWLSTGVFAGFAGGRTHNKSIDMDQQGGYFGLYGSYNIYHMRTSAIATVGKMDTEIPRKFGGASLDNIWADISSQTTFDILLDPTLTLQPGLRVSYTWAQSENYTTLERTRITNENFNLFSIAPQFRIIKHIGLGWFGTASVRYVWRLTDGGETYASSGIKIHDFDTGNYTEYGIGLEKLFGSINTSIDIRRQDGARYGWQGGAHLKYVF